VAPARKRSPTVPAGLAAGRAVADDVAGDDVLLAARRWPPRRATDDAAAGQALADVVVGVALEPQRDAAGQEGAEDWPAEPVSVMSMVSSGRPAPP
jgi:hypothetical protein